MASHIKRRKTCALQAADNTAAGSISYCTCRVGYSSWISIPCRAGSGVIGMVSLRLVTKPGFCRFMFVLGLVCCVCFCVPAKALPGGAGNSDAPQDDK